MLAILLGLGTWQLHRRAWKRDLLDRIEAAERAPGVPLGADPEPFAKVAATGVFSPQTALYGVELRGETLGAHLLQPLERPGAAAVLVDRGWVDAGRPPPATPAGAVTVEGYVRPPEHPAWLSARDEPEHRRFFTLDPQPIASVLGVPGALPFTLVAMGPRGLPDPVQALPRPPNDHLQYAMTWYGFAVTLLVIYGLTVRRILHERV